MDAVDKLVIQVALDNKALKDTLQKSTNVINDFSKNAKDSLGKIFDYFVSYEALKYTKDLVEGFAKTGTQLYYLSQTIGVNVSQIDKWEQAAKRTGGTAEGMAGTLHNLFSELNKGIYNQNPDFLRGLAALNIDPHMRNAAGQITGMKDANQLLTELSTQLYKMPRANAYSLAKILGIDDNTFNLIYRSQTQLNALMSDVQKSGVLTEAQAKNAAELTAQWAALGQTWDITKNTLASSLMPALQGLTDWLSEVVTLLAKAEDAFHSFQITIDPKTGGISTSGGSGFWSNIVKSITGGHAATAAEKNAFKLGLNQPANNKPGMPGMFAGDDAITRAQRLKESGGNPNAIGGQHEAELTYGSYQMRLSTARELARKHGLPTPTVNDLLNPSTSKAYRDMYMAEGVQQAMMDKPGMSKDYYTAASLAYYNGGKGGLQHYENTGQSYNGYAESIINNAAHNPIPQSASLQPGSARSGVKPGNAITHNVHVANLNLPSVSSPPDFAEALVQQTQPGYAFSSGIVA